MKKETKLIYGREEQDVTRRRAAYLLRAARSRRSNNVTRVANGYALNDCSHAIIFESHAK